MKEISRQIISMPVMVRTYFIPREMRETMTLLEIFLSLMLTLESIMRISMFMYLKTKRKRI